MTMGLTLFVNLACVSHFIIKERLILDKYQLEIYLIILLGCDAFLHILNSLDALCK